MAEVIQTNLDTSIILPTTSLPSAYRINAVAVGNDIYIASLIDTYYFATYKYNTVNKILTTLIASHTINPSMSAFRPLIYKDGYIYMITGGDTNQTYAYIHRYSISGNEWTMTYKTINCGARRPRAWGAIDNKFVSVGFASSSYAFAGICIDPETGDYNINQNDVTRAPADGQIAGGYYFGTRARSDAYNDYGKITLSDNVVTNTTKGTYTSDISNASTFIHNDIVYAIRHNTSYMYNIDNDTFSQIDIIHPFTSGNIEAIYLNGVAYLFGNTGLFTISFIEYNLQYDIKNKDGSVTYVSIENASPITKIRFNYSGSGDVGYVFNTLSGQISGTYTPQIPDGYRLGGFSRTSNAQSAAYGFNADITISIMDDFTFYEAYQKYVPPATTFDVTLYRNAAEPNRVDKSSYLTAVGTLSGALREECSIINPTITIDYDHVPEFNYVYIAVFNRYYFVTNITSTRKNLWRIELKCDVLMSFKTGIESLRAIIARQENYSDPLLIDDKLLLDKDVNITFVEITSTAFSTDLSGSDVHNYVLSAVGAQSINP